MARFPTPPPSDRLCIVVLGYIVRGPLGGLVWHHLQYVMGLARLGHEVYFLEDSGDTRWCCYDPSRNVTDDDPTYGLDFARDAFALVDLPDCWAYYDAHTGRWLGPAAGDIPRVCRHADIVLNLSAANPIRPWLEQVPRRVLIDTDPAFTQVRNLTDPVRRAQAAQHTDFFSYGENIGRGATVPDDGIGWCPTRQPIVLEEWPVAPGAPDGHFTTVMQWNSYVDREYDGRRFGMKSESFARVMELPRRTTSLFEVAVGGNAPFETLREHGWVLRSPYDVARDANSYRTFVQQSKAEFTVAKQGYVTTACGWFSDRSAAYLASGRPVVTEDTGWTGQLPPGEGVVTFSSPDEAVCAIEEVNRRYGHHCRMARVIAEECFDSKRVLERLLSDISSHHGATPALGTAALPVSQGASGA